MGFRDGAVKWISRQQDYRKGYDGIGGKQHQNGCDLGGLLLGIFMHLDLVGLMMFLEFLSKFLFVDVQYGFYCGPNFLR